MPRTPRDPDAAPPAALPDPDPRSRPLAAAGLGAEALLLAAVATVTLVWTAGGQIDGRFGTGLGIFLLLFAAGAGLAARSVVARGRFGLGYGITWQMFQALVGASLLRGGLLWQGGLALLLAIAVFVLLTRLVRSTPLPDGERGGR